jgi:hypothetical protein
MVHAVIMNGEVRLIPIDPVVSSMMLKSARWEGGGRTKKMVNLQWQNLNVRAIAC